ncbi:hypothetical protein JCM15764A_15960 [Geotalea toluenoxydans]
MVPLLIKAADIAFNKGDIKEYVAPPCMVEWPSFQWGQKPQWPLVSLANRIYRGTPLPYVTAITG